MNERMNIITLVQNEPSQTHVKWESVILGTLRSSLCADSGPEPVPVEVQRTQQTDAELSTVPIMFQNLLSFRTKSPQTRAGQFVMVHHIPLIRGVCTLRQPHYFIMAFLLTSLSRKGRQKKKKKKGTSHNPLEW